MSAQPLLEEFRRKTRDEGRQEGRRQGRRQGRQEVVHVAMLASERLARPLSAQELKRLSDRLGELGADRTTKELHELSPEQLQRWIAADPG